MNNGYLENSTTQGLLSLKSVLSNQDREKSTETLNRTHNHPRNLPKNQKKTPLNLPLHTYSQVLSFFVIFDFPTMKASVKRVMNKFLTSLLFVVPKANMLLFRSGLNQIGVGTLCNVNGSQQGKSRHTLSLRRLGVAIIQVSVFLLCRKRV